MLRIWVPLHIDSKATGSSRREPHGGSLCGRYLVPVGSRSKSLFHAAAEVVRREYLPVGAIAEDVHRELVIPGVGHGQHQMAGRLDMLSLLGMPDLAGYPGRDVRFEAQYRRVLGSTSENPIATAKVRVERFIRDFVCWRVADFGIPDHIQGKAAKAVAQMAPGIQVPVRPI